MGVVIDTGVFIRWEREGGTSRNGNTIGPHDNWIAATALKYDYNLLTTNVAEFSRVPNLRIIDYPNSS